MSEVGMSEDMPLPDVPAWPVQTVELRGDGQVRVDGEHVPVPPGTEPRAAAIAVVAGTASLIGRPVRAEAREADGTVWPLVVTPDGRAIAAGTPRHPAPGRRGRRRPGMIRRSAPTPARPSPGPPPVSGAPTVVEGLPGVPEPVPATGSSSAVGWAKPAEPFAPPERPPPPPEPPAPPGPAPSPASPPPAAAAALARVTDALRSGHPYHARQAAAALVDELAAEAGPEHPATRAAREVLAFVGFAAGRPLWAGKLYAGLAESAVSESSADRERLVDNAHFCWVKAASTPGARELGEAVVRLRADGPPGPAAAAARLLARDTGRG